VRGLGPSLTVYDRRVLMAVPPSTEAIEHGGTNVGRTVWQIAEALETVEVAGLAQILRGLERFGYVASRKGRKRGRVVWWRTARGDEAL
jgi:hypothetical protein